MTAREAIDICNDAHEKGEQPNLRGAYLRYANLRGADLEGADLRGANLGDVNLTGADLRGADLRGAYLRYANLRGANLRDADLGGADLGYADLGYADLGGAYLGDVNLTGADLRGANLRGAYLEGATLPEGVTFEAFLEDVLPTLLMAGGKPLASFAESWQCNTWQNCPMHHAFDASDLNDVPAIYRPWAERFIQFFDAGLISWSAVESGIQQPEGAE